MYMNVQEYGRICGIFLHFFCTDTDKFCTLTDTDTDTATATNTTNTNLFSAVSNIIMIKASPQQIVDKVLCHDSLQALNRG